MQYNEKTALLAQLSVALLDEAKAVLDPEERGEMVRSAYGHERSIGTRLSRIGAGLVALDTIGRALR